jgi:hypothetical protein
MREMRGYSIFYRLIVCAVAAAFLLSPRLVLSETKAYPDQNKLYYDDTHRWILYYEDDDGDDYHDPGESYYQGPDTTEKWRKDMSCWMASACNILEKEGHDHPYKDYLKDGGAPSPNTTPWGDAYTAPGGGNAMTFDDGGWQHYLFAHVDVAYEGPIITDEEFGTWSQHPVIWCCDPLFSGDPVGVTYWRGTPAKGSKPGWDDRKALDAYHAITVWDIECGTPDVGTLLISDSDDRINGSDEVVFMCDGLDFQIWEDETFIGHVNYAVALKSEVPVVLAIFQATGGQGFITLDWTTASEINCHRWEICRSDVEEGEYAKIGELPGHGSTEAENTYQWIDRRVRPDETYFYKLKQVDFDGSEWWSQIVSATAGAAVPETYALHQNYPNPFNPTTEITYAIPRGEHVALKIYNIKGAEVATLFDGDQSPGSHTMSWNADDLGSGVYFCRLQAGEFGKTIKMILLR